MNNKYVTAATIASCSLLGMYNYGYNEMTGVKPMADYTLNFTEDNPFSRFIVQQSSVQQILASYKPSWFYASPLMGNAASVLLVPLKEMPKHETVQVRSRSG